jgi:hypothetical protein
MNAQSQVSSNSPAIITKLRQPANSQGEVQITEDPKIDNFLAKMIDANAKRGTVRGYRILVFRENSQRAKERAMDARAKFLSKFPDTEAHLEVQAPLWWVYVGDFRTLTDAFRMKKQIETLFPIARIAPANINYTKL